MLIEGRYKIYNYNNYKMVKCVLTSLGQVNLLKALVLYTGIEYSGITFFIPSASIQGENFIFSNIV